MIAYYDHNRYELISTPSRRMSDSVIRAEGDSPWPDGQDPYAGCDVIAAGECEAMYAAARLLLEDR